MSSRWQEHAACKDTDPDLFDPPVARETTDSIRLRVKDANNWFCHTCPVADACAAHAAANRDDGIRAGVMYANGKPLTPRDVYKSKPRGPQKPRERRDPRTLAGAKYAELLDNGWTITDICIRYKVKPASVRVAMRRAEQPKPRRECGTYGAYRRHLNLGEPIDDPCQVANNIHMAKIRPRPHRVPCGTKRAYNRHLERGEQPCEDCRRANADAIREYRRRWDRAA
jgi:hypothetical protein